MRTLRNILATLAVLSLTVSIAARQTATQQLPLPTPSSPAKGSPPKVERLGANLFHVGRIRVDTAKREVSVTGKTNDVTTLEFVANTIGGLKAYESALTLDTDAITFNTALLLIGLDKKHSVAPTRHFDVKVPTGDSVELWVDWTPPGSSPQHVRVEQLLFDKRTNRPLAEDPWVYTGSAFTADGQYLAELDGVLIGFAHSPAPIIETGGPGTVGAYGAVILNPNLGLPREMPITLTLKTLPASSIQR